MKLDQYALMITEEDLQGRDQLWIDLGPGRGRIHLSLHKQNFRIAAWVDKTWGKLTKKVHRL